MGANESQEARKLWQRLEAHVDGIVRSLCRRLTPLPAVDGIALDSSPNITMRSGSWPIATYISSRCQCALLFGAGPIQTFSISNPQRSTKQVNQKQKSHRQGGGVKASAGFHGLGYWDIIYKWRLQDKAEKTSGRMYQPIDTVQLRQMQVCIMDASPEREMMKTAQYFLLPRMTRQTH